MKIILLSHKTIGEVKDEFSSIYPFLKIEFFERSKGSSEGEIRNEEVLPPTVAIESAEDAVDVKPSDTVKEVERKLNDQYGLPAQIFRKQNGVWRDTAITDDLTLQEQNTWGREASKPLKVKTENRFNWR